MFKRQTKSDIIFGVVNGTLLTIILFIILFPLIFVLSASISNPMEVLNGNVVFLPKDISFDAYARVFKDSSILRGYLNTIVYTILGTLLNLAFTVMVAFPLSRKDLVGRKAITIFFMITTFFSGGIIPTYLINKAIGLVNNPLIMVVRGAVSVWNVVIMRTFLESIPYEMQEAAFIDGCSNTKTLIKIILPVSKASLAVMALYYGVAHWNEFMGALIYLDKKEYYPLQLILRNILLVGQMETLTEATTESLAQQQMLAEGIKYAVIVVASAPIIAIYPFLQKYFIQGVMVGSVKG